jgi:hypothetical protein
VGEAHDIISSLPTSPLAEHIKQFARSVSSIGSRQPSL